MAAGVLVGVVADDRAVRDAAVDPAVDPRQPCGDLVDGPVQVVDPALQRDGEVDEIRPAAAHERPLCLTQAPDPCPGPGAEPEAHGADAATRDRQDRCCRSREHASSLDEN